MEPLAGRKLAKFATGEGPVVVAGRRGVTLRIVWLAVLWICHLANLDRIARIIAQEASNTPVLGRTAPK